MFGSRKALLKQPSYTAVRGEFSPNSYTSGLRPQDASPGNGDRVQAALLAATKDRESAQAALAEAKTRQEETAEELSWCMKELAQLQKEKNDWRCNSWLEHATGRSTILAATPGQESIASFDEHGASNAQQHAAQAAATAAAAEAQLQAAEQQSQELQSQLHHQEVRVANAEAAQRSAESERDAMAQENARLEEHIGRHQQGARQQEDQMQLEALLRSRDQEVSSLSHRLNRMQQELDMTVQRGSAQEQSLQASLTQTQKEREQLQFELQHARSALESHASEREYMQSEASSLQQALQTQAREAQQAQQAHESWVTRSQHQEEEMKGLQDSHQELQQQLTGQVEWWRGQVDDLKAQLRGEATRVLDLQKKAYTAKMAQEAAAQAQQAAEANLQQATSSLNQQQHSLQQQHAQQAQHALQLAGQVADLEERCGMLTQHKTAAEADAACAMRQAESAEAKSTQLQHEIESLRQQLQTSKDSEAADEAMHRKLTELQLSHTQELESAQAELVHVQTAQSQQLESVRSELAEVTSQHAATSTQLQELQQQRDVAVSEAREASKSAAALTETQEKVDRLQASQEELTQQTSTAQSQLLESQQQLELAQSKAKTKGDEQQQLAAAVERLEADAQAVRQDLAAAQTDRQNALSKLAELEGVLQQALDQRVHASEEVLRSQSHLTKKTSELNAAQQHLQRQQQELAALQLAADGAAALKQTVHQLQQQLHNSKVAAQQSEHQLQEQVQQLRRTSSDKENSLVQLQQRCQSADVQLQALQAVGCERDSIVHQLSGQVSSLRVQANEHRMIKEKLQAAIAAALSGDCCADTDLLPPQLCSVTAEETGNAEAAKHASVMDLQDAISTLKERSDSVKSMMALPTPSQTRPPRSPSISKSTAARDTEPHQYVADQLTVPAQAPQQLAVKQVASGMKLSGVKSRSTADMQQPPFGVPSSQDAASNGSSESSELENQEALRRPLQKKGTSTLRRVQSSAEPVLKQRGQGVLHSSRSSNSLQPSSSRPLGLPVKAYLGSRVGSVDVHNGPHRLSTLKQ